MPYDERKFASEMRQIVKTSSFFKTSTAIEYKLKLKGKRLNFKSDFQPQQLEYLKRSAEHPEGVYHKISDMDPSLKPFDAMYLIYAKAYVIVCWYDKGKSKNVYVIPYHVICNLVEKGVKSISEEDSQKLSSLFIKL